MVRRVIEEREVETVPPAAPATYGDPVWWVIGLLVVAAIIVLAVLAATGTFSRHSTTIVPSNAPSPVPSSVPSTVFSSSAPAVPSPS
jgi:hypothetical protein